MPLLARRAASATERTLVYFRMNYVHEATHGSQFQPPRIKAYRAAAGLGPTFELGHSRRFYNARVISAHLPTATGQRTWRDFSKVA